MLAVVIILNVMATQSTKENVLDTLRNSVLINHIDEEELEIIAQSIVENLCIEHDRAPKWE
jgi:hypothetical protein